MSEIINQIKNFVEEECKKPSSKYGYEPFHFHFIPVVEYAKELSEKLNLKEEQKEIVELAAWLHDIGSIIHGREDHHLTGASIAERKLKELNYPEEKIILIKKCILNHRGSVDNKQETIEENIVSDADALANFEDISGIFKAAYCFEGHKSQEKAAKIVYEKLERKWNKLCLEESKKIIKPKYEAVRLLFC